MRPIAPILLDLVAIFAAGVASLILRDNLEVSKDKFFDLLPYLSFSLLSASIVLPTVGASRGVWRYSTFGDFLRVGIAATIVVLAATTASFAYNRLDGLARAVPIVHLLLMICFMGALRAVTRLRHDLRLRAESEPAGVGTHQDDSVLIIGMNSIAELFVRSARTFSCDSVQLVGILDWTGRYRGRVLHGVPVLGVPDDLEAVLRQLSVHGITVARIVVTVAPSELSQPTRDSLAEIERGMGVQVDRIGERLGFFLPDRAVRKHSAVVPVCIAANCKTLPNLREMVGEAHLSRTYWRLKRVVDIAASSILILATAPVTIIVAVVVALDIGVPVLFWQERPGRFGKRLRIYKFRTMRSAHDADGTIIPESERLSRMGRALRRSRLDELPQLFNILKGEMSFVGPRPLLPADQSSAHSGRLAVRPGLSGWAQVNGGRDIDPEDKAAMDIWYIRNATFSLDLRIAAKTVRMIVLGEKPNRTAIAVAWDDARALRSPYREAARAAGPSRRDVSQGAA